MTLPWCPLPRALLTSPRARMLPLDAVGALLVAWSLSDDDGTIAPARDRTAVEALVFVVAQHARESGDFDGEAHAHAADSVAELLDSGLIVEDGDALRLDGWVFLDGAPLPRPAPVGSSSPLPGPDSPRRPGRPRKGAEIVDGAERKRRTRFEAREGSFRDVPAGVTYEEWTAAKLPDDRRETPPRNSASPRNSAAKLRRETPVEGRASDPEDQKDAEKKDGEGDSGARDRRETPPRNSAAKLPDDRRETPARCGTVERVTPLDPDVTLDRMRGASGGRFSSAATSMQMQSFGVIARELIARGHATPDALVKAAGHAPHVAWICRLPGPLTVQRLCADEGRVLIELLTGCATCAECGGDPLASGVIDVAAKTGDPALDELEAKRAEWQRKYDEQQAARAAKGAA
jgi:hypothetical protein